MGEAISNKLSSGARYGEIEKKSLFCNRVGSSVSIIPAIFLGANSKEI